ncbi:citrulline utilization hydrolase CtlX [Sphingobacterium sp. LRF_L2]|uniref:citrulline utilization hydrolase CtlX n=1 Tax=Sphingobacterium sp. LRF_L2 TaxID=3369421 RepID=UPI003F63E407
MTSLLMIRPVAFGFNAQTAVNNAFQQQDENIVQVKTKAIEEFDNFVDKLKCADIDVLVIEDTEEPHTPDSLFPNNWISFHEDGKVVLYPMYAENRRLERKETVLSTVYEKFKVNELLDLSAYEQQGIFLEGTGSFVLDRDRKIAYACLSPRTDAGLFTEVCDLLGYQAVVFHAYDKNGAAIYHTNVMMCIADSYAVINLDSIPEDEREGIKTKIEESGKDIIAITHEQMDHFAGNMLQVRNSRGIPYLIMSTQAWETLDEVQKQLLKGRNPIIHSDLATIERNGGGSARCMMAEVFLQSNF